MRIVSWFIVSTTIVVGGCVSTDPSLATDVKRLGGGVYSVNGIGFVNPSTQAGRQCQIDGGQLNIISHGFVTAFSGTKYPEIIFRCDK